MHAVIDHIIGDYIGISMSTVTDSCVHVSSVLNHGPSSDSDLCDYTPTCNTNGRSLENCDQNPLPTRFLLFAKGPT
jgi:hypothetical protein